MVLLFAMVAEIGGAKVLSTKAVAESCCPLALQVQQALH